MKKLFSFLSLILISFVGFVANGMSFSSSNSSPPVCITAVEEETLIIDVQVSGTNDATALIQPTTEGLVTEIVFSQAELQADVGVTLPLASNSSLMNSNKVAENTGIMRDDRCHILKHPLSRPQAFVSSHYNQA